MLQGFVVTYSQKSNPSIDEVIIAPVLAADESEIAAGFESSGLNLIGIQSRAILLNQIQMIDDLAIDKGVKL